MTESITPAPFSAEALRLSGMAIRLTGWPPDTFWAATPAELAAILTPVLVPETRPLGREDFARLMEMDDE